jgi:hypothetical protein
VRLAPRRLEILIFLGLFKLLVLSDARGCFENLINTSASNLGGTYTNGMLTSIALAVVLTRQDVFVDVVIQPKPTEGRAVMGPNHKLQWTESPNHQLPFKVSVPRDFANIRSGRNPGNRAEREAAFLLRKPEKIFTVYVLRPDTATTLMLMGGMGHEHSLSAPTKGEPISVGAFSGVIAPAEGSTPGFEALLRNGEGQMIYGTVFASRGPASNEDRGLLSKIIRSVRPIGVKAVEARASGS